MSPTRIKRVISTSGRARKAIRIKMAMLALSLPTAYLGRKSSYMLSGNIQTDGTATLLWAQLPIHRPTARGIGTP
jgi:hypothetical protein